MKKIKKLWHWFKTKVKYYTDAEGWLKWWTKRQAIKRSIQIAKTMKPVELDDHPFKWEAITTWPKEERPAKLDVPEGTIAIRTNPKRKKSLLGIVGQYKRADGTDPITTIVLQVEDKTIVEEISSGKRKATED